jgi:tryptophanase
MDRQEGIKYKYKNFRIDWQGYDTDDLKKREERVDVSPAGTEGIFIDMESPECDGDE